MCRDRKHDWDTPDDIEDEDLDNNSSSSDDIPNAVRYVPTSSGSPVKVVSRAEKREPLGAANPVLSNPSGKILIYRKVQDRNENEPFYSEFKEEIVRELDHTITLKIGKQIRISDLAVKRPSVPKKISPRKKLLKF